MSEPYIGEIQLFGFNFNPRGWAFCNGATIPIQQNTALFSLLGTTYGGNGQTTFQLPNFAARAACAVGNGPGLSARTAGETFGLASVTLTSAQMPSHTHSLNIFSQPNTDNRVNTPVANGALSFPGTVNTKPFVSGTTTPNTQFAPTMLQGTSGGGSAHQNQQPYLGVNFCIALQGVFPAFE